MVSMDNDEPHIFIVQCLGCGKTLALSGDSKDELRERLAESSWQMVADEAMADPITDDVDFLCPDCLVKYMNEP